MYYEFCKPSQIPKDWYGKITGFDIETEDEWIDSPICLAQIYNPYVKEGRVIPIKAYSKGQLIQMPDEELSIFKEYLSSIRAVGHHLQFDLAQVLYQWGVDVDLYFDTFLFARMMQWDKQGLKDIIINMFPEAIDQVRKFADVMDTDDYGNYKKGSKSSNQRSAFPLFVYDLGNKAQMDYAAHDPFFPFLIINRFKDAIRKYSKVIKIEHDFLKIAVQVKGRGLNVNLDTFDKVFQEFQAKVQERNDELDKIAGFHVRPNATADKKKLLIGVLGCTPTILTQKGEPSMSEEALKLMLDNADSDNKVEIIELLLELVHDFAVIKGSKKLPGFVIDGKVHPKIEQIGYDGTARVYSRDPSVNQIPKNMRAAFVPDKGKKFVMFDWKGAELYIAAYWSKCQKVLDWVRVGVDMHTEISRRLLGKETITKEERDVSKVVTFATMFGSEGGAVGRALNLPFEEASKLVQAYLDMFPEIKALRAKIIGYAHRNYCTKTIFGRVRKLPNINSDDSQKRESSERQAFNTAIQASCADFFKVAAHRSLKYKDKGVRWVFGVFDSHLLEVPEEMTEDEIRQIADDMSDFSDIFEGFRFRYDMAIGHDWYECQSKL